MSMLAVLPSILTLGGKLIQDSDKRAEYAFKMQDMAQVVAMKLLETKTYPWIDGLVKLAYAGEVIVKGLLRPLGAAAMTGFFIYCEVKGIELSAATETVLVSAFPAWGISRHTEKAKKQQEDEW